jgi:hypothetical protein
MAKVHIIRKAHEFSDHPNSTSKQNPANGAETDRFLLSVVTASVRILVIDFSVSLRLEYFAETLIYICIYISHRSLASTDINFSGNIQNISQLIPISRTRIISYLRDQRLLMIKSKYEITELLYYYILNTEHAKYTI